MRRSRQDKSSLGNPFKQQKSALFLNQASAQISKVNSRQGLNKTSEQEESLQNSTNKIRFQFEDKKASPVN